jgi:large subunit ribosomal protein L10
VVLSLNDKKAIVSEVSEQAQQAVSALGADYRGMSVTELTELRKRARNQGIYMKVIRNTLAKRAIVGTEFECMQDSLKGPMLLAFCKDDPGAPARLIKDFMKQAPKLEVTVLSIGGKAFGGESLDRVASLPTKQQAIGQLASVTQAPISKMVRTVAETYTKFVRVVNAVAEQKKSM